MFIHVQQVVDMFAGLLLGFFLELSSFRGLSFRHSSLSLVSFTDPRPFFVLITWVSNPYWVQGSMGFDLADCRSVDVSFCVCGIEVGRGGCEGLSVFALVSLHLGNNMLVIGSLS